MPQGLMDLMLSRCSHEFSWPRRAADGHYYQVCLLCAVEYKYDWKTMRRIERVEHSAPETAPVTRRGRGHSRGPTWVPRARRLKLQLPVRYRARSSASWSEGIIENLSQSGMFFRGPKHFPPSTLVEMIFEMPEEISRQKHSSALCQGRITRAKEASDGPEAAALAASILDYKFLH